MLHEEHAEEKAIGVILDVATKFIFERRLSGQWGLHSRCNLPGKVVGGPMRAGGYRGAEYSGLGERRAIEMMVRAHAGALVVQHIDELGQAHERPGWYGHGMSLV